MLYLNTIYNSGSQLWSNIKPLQQWFPTVVQWTSSAVVVHGDFFGGPQDFQLKKIISTDYSPVIILNLTQSTFYFYFD